LISNSIKNFIYRMVLNIFMKVEELRELGLDEKQLKILFVLKNGPLSGPEIEKLTELRQPEISRALRELRIKGYVRLLRGEKRFKRGAPCKIWELQRPFNDIIKEIVSKKLIDLDKKLRICVHILFELGEPISGADPEIVKAIKELKDDDVLVVEFRRDGDVQQ
jgi:predicted transcriptional regulator